MASVANNSMRLPDHLCTKHFESWVLRTERSHGLTVDQGNNLVELFKGVVGRDDSFRTFESRVQEWKEPLGLSDQIVGRIQEAARHFLPRPIEVAPHRLHHMPMRAAFLPKPSADVQAKVEKMAKETEGLAKTAALLAHEGENVKVVAEEMSQKSRQMCQLSSGRVSHFRPVAAVAPRHPSHFIQRAPSAVHRMTVMPSPHFRPFLAHHFPIHRPYR